MGFTAVDHRTDIYSIGVVMYHLLTGRLPFEAANNFSLIYQITNTRAEPPSRLRPGLPAQIDAIVMRAMASDREERYPRWEEFSLPWPGRGLLLVHTDGIQTHWKLEAYSGLQGRHASVIAGVLYRDFRRTNDDSTVVVLKEP